MNFLPKQTAGIILLILLLAFSFFYKLTGIPIRIWDEARLANSALYMHLHGNWLIPHYDGQPDMWSTKPPLMIWFQVMWMKIIGINEWAIRLPSAIASVCTTFLIWWFCKKETGKPWMAFLAGAVFATTFANVYLHAGLTGDYDALLVFFISSYCLSIYQYVIHQNKKWLYLFWIFLTLASLTKGVAGMMMLPGVAIFVLISGKLKSFLLSRHFYIGTAIFLFLVGGYYLWRNHLNPGYIRAVWDNELGGRYLQTLEQHKHPFSHYFEYMRSWRYTAWFYFIIPSFVFGLMYSKETRRLSIFNFLITIPYLLIISASQTKLEWYELPVYPFFSIQIALFFYQTWQILDERNKGISKFSRQSIAALSIGLMLLIPLRDISRFINDFKEHPWDIEPHQQGYFLQDAIKNKRNLNNYIFLYDGYNGQLRFYTDKLKHEGINVDLRSESGNLQPGQHVVINQVQMKEKLESAYLLEKKKEIFGCTEYIVIRKL